MPKLSGGGSVGGGAGSFFMSVGGMVLGIGFSLLLTYFLNRKKKPPVEEPKPLEITVDSSGEPLPIVFGTRYVIPKTAWWGNTKILKISAAEAGKKK